MLHKNCNYSFSYILRILLVPIMLIYLLTTNIRVVKADTIVGGPIISDTTWTLGNSPYIVTANIEIWSGVTLTIEPGVTVKFDSQKLLTVDSNGSFIAQGNALQPITFTSNQPNPQPQDWGYIDLRNADPNISVLNYCVVRYGGSGINFPGGVITVNGIDIDHCKFEYNFTGIYANNSTITNNVITYNNQDAGLYQGGGITAYNSNILNNTVANNSSTNHFGCGGIYADNSMVSNNIVYGNQGPFKSCGGISGTNGSMVSNNNVYQNHGRGITVGGSEAKDNLVKYNDGGGVGAQDSLVQNNNVYGNSIPGEYFAQGGGIAAIGGKVVENIVSNNFISGNSAEGGGIYSGGSIVISNTVVNNQIGYGQGSGIYYYGGVGNNQDFLHNVVVGNSDALQNGNAGGVVVTGAQTNFHYNSIYNNHPFDLVIVDSKDVDGTNNFWGTSNSVDILAHVYDWYDDTSLGRFLYIPYLQDPDANTPVPPPLNLKGVFSNSSVTLTWDPIPSTTTGYGYKIYYDTDTLGPPYNGTGANEGDSPIDVGNATNYTLTGLGNGPYYIGITAYDTSGHEGWYSNFVASSSDISISKTDFPDPVAYNGTITYTLTVTNNGPFNATGVYVTDELPNSVQFKSSQPGSPGCQWTGTQVYCFQGDLAVNESAVYKIVANVVTSASNVITNTAQSFPNNPDPNYSNNIATEGTHLIPPSCPNITQWKGEYWNNENLIGSPALCRNDPAINFNWQSGSPDPIINPDHFSARWTRNITFTEGTYLISIYHDDGARFYIDGHMILNEWCSNCAVWDYIKYSIGQGPHQVILEMHESSGYSGAILSWQLVKPLSGNIYLPEVLNNSP